MGRERFESAYLETPPWDIPGPQPAIVELQEAGAIGQAVLDAGCGTGENALFLASRGHEVWGIDFIPTAIDRARAKAEDRGLAVHFRVGDAFALEDLGREFDTVIDCGLFHTFSDEDRPRYISGLGAVVRPGGRVIILCFSDEEPPGQGPRRISQRELREAFRDGWEIAEIRPASFQTTEHPEARTFTPGGPRAWLAQIVRASRRMAVEIANPLSMPAPLSGRGGASEPMGGPSHR
ncbi:MAG: class I SAM-dependent methyltransferase [Isosphaeraceae bacterium]